MGDAKFTPGPWSAEDTNGAKLSMVVVAAPEENGSWAVIGQCGGLNKEANACLIAAAPDLYEALDSFPIRESEDESHYLGRVTEWWIRKGGKALAKARGEPCPLPPKRDRE